MNRKNSLKKGSIDLIRKASSRHGKKIVYSCSFGAEDMVLLDLICKSSPGIRIITLDTGRLPQATHDLMDKCRGRYGIDIDIIFPDTAEVEEMVNSRGNNLFYHSVENRKLCCEIRKVRPLRRALQGMEAWITGITRYQSMDRGHMQAIEDDPVFGLIKYNPLIEWTWQDVWDYIRANGVPYNRLHDEHYASIGCEPCTRAITAGEDLRAGRWWWEEGDAAAECGLHMDPVRPPRDKNEQSGGSDE